MDKKVVFVMLMLLSLSLVSAHDINYDNYAFKEKISETTYFPHQDKVVTTTTYIDYDNDERFPTYDYRHGYTYRNTKEYKDSYKVKITYNKDYQKDHKKIYEYVSPSREYKQGGCYHVAPKGKLFYIKC
jgi:hypothetical protein